MIKKIERLAGVNKDLVAVIIEASKTCEIDFLILEGVRTLERQQMLLKAAKSRTLKSKHLEGKAVDIGAIVDGKLSWEWKYYEIIAESIKDAASTLNTDIQWGGDWKTFKDGVHFQLKS